MAYVEYLLGKTGLFPKYQPQAYDVLRAAFRAYEIRKVRNARGKVYYCIIPSERNLGEIYRMAHLFWGHGIFLIPKKPKTNNRTETAVFWVRDRGQQFMLDTFHVNRNANNFQEVLKRYNARKQTTLQKLFGKFENEM